MTHRIYYTDPYTAEFDAKVIAVEPAPAGDQARTGVLLDRTAFYPTSGGQPFDVGQIGGARVVDVIDREDGSILHVVDGPPGTLVPWPADTLIHGAIDWARRFDHMQQHTGQHVLSAAFDRLLRVRTVSFHLGSSSSTIDLHREVSAAEIERAESEANRVVWEDRPVSIRFADAAEAAELPLRKESQREGLLRLIEVESFDVSACGGTHVSRTGAIGIIGVISTERFRGGTRIEFVCGGRALASLRTLRDAMASSTRLLSVVGPDLPAAIDRLQTESKETRRQVKDLQSRLAEHEASALADRADAVGAVKVVLAALEGYDATGLKALAQSIASRPGHVAVLLSAAAPAALVVARAPDVTVDAGALLRQLTAAFGGKGGGRPEMAQGGGLQGAPAAILSAARAALGGGGGNGGDGGNGR
jgi:alanyl-tRNA synthetase